MKMTLVWLAFHGNGLQSVSADEGHGLQNGSAL
jgi:hypothetical protein